jgi:uncharacterized membrane protein
MTPQTRNGLTDAYLSELRRAARDLPKHRRVELTAEIEAHLREAIPQNANEADTRNALDLLGTPEQIIAEERERLGPPAATGGTFEWIAVALLLFSFIPILGWLIGVIMLWSSRVWTTRDKVLGTLFVPGGLYTSLFVLAAGFIAQTCTTSGGPGRPTITHCTPGPSTAATVGQIALAVFVIASPIVTAVYLASRIRRPAARPA